MAKIIPPPNKKWPKFCPLYIYGQNSTPSTHLIYTLPYKKLTLIPLPNFKWNSPYGVICFSFDLGDYDFIPSENVNRVSYPHTFSVNGPLRVVQENIPQSLEA